MGTFGNVLGYVVRRPPLSEYNKGNRAMGRRNGDGVGDGDGDGDRDSDGNGDGYGEASVQAVDDEGMSLACAGR